MPQVAEGMPARCAQCSALTSYKMETAICKAQRAIVPAAGPCPLAGWAPTLLDDMPATCWMAPLMPTAPRTVIRARRVRPVMRL